MCLSSLFLYFCLLVSCFLFFFFTAPATTEISTLSLHDALPIFSSTGRRQERHSAPRSRSWRKKSSSSRTSDRKSTRLNSSHVAISYAVFCLKKKKKKKNNKHIFKSTISTRINQLH